MADSSSNELPRTRSEYIPPTTIPPAVNHATIPDERVRIAGQQDRRFAKTLFSKRAAQRASRRALWSLIAAAAFGAGLAALLFVRHFGPEASPTKERHGVVTLEPNLEAPKAAGSAPVLNSLESSSAAHQAVPEVASAPTPPAEAVSPKVQGAATPEAAEPSALSEPVEARPSPSAPPQQDNTDSPPSAASASASGNKVWLKPPQRKAWLD